MGGGSSSRVARLAVPDRSLPRIVERFARTRPDAPAVRAAGHALGYAALNRRANRIAALLRARGIGSGSLVGLALPRSPELIAALLGILKAGAAYVPLDPDYPAERLRLIAGRARLRCVVGESAFIAALGLAEVPALCPDADARALQDASDADPGLALDPAAPCYLIFTSGSTGEPKGVVVSHGNVARLFDHLGPALGCTPDDAWSQLHSLAFGFSAFEVWGALGHGACLVLAPVAARADALVLREFLGREGITVLSQTPSAFRETLLGAAFDQAWPPPALRLLVLSGEAVQARDLARWAATRSAGGPRLVNTYAITETGGNVLLREYGAGDGDARNIGHPLPDVSVHVCDEAGRELPTGEAGELLVGGPGIALGYADDAALTASRFILWPDGERVYRTGDRVRRCPDGSLEFLGRIDEQLKWHGFRLEPGEIETLLRAHPQVAAAAVALRHDAAGRERLVAYVVPGQEAAARGAEFWPSLGGYQVYDDFLHDLMSSDALRNAAFRSAFERHAPGRVVLDIGCGPHALLARMAAEAGARHVYAVELMPEMAEKARAAVAAAGLADRITVITGDAAEVPLPEPIGLCTQGIIGNIGSADGIAAIWNRVRGRFSADAVAVPARCTTWIAPVELPASLRAAPLLAPLAREYAERIFAGEGRRFDLRLCLRGLPPGQLLAEPQLFEDLDFAGELPAAHAGRGDFRLARSGRFDGFLLWTQVFTTSDTQIDYLHHQHAWLPVFLPLPEDGPELDAGTRIEAAWHWQPGSDGLFPDYTVEAVVARDGGERHVCHSRHHGSVLGGTALHRRLLAQPAAGVDGVAPAELRAWLGQQLPAPLLPSAWVYLDALPLNPNGKLDRRALPMPAAGSWGGRGAEPGTALERELAAIWAEVLGVPAIGVEDDFFDLGGDSLAAVRLTTRVQQLLDDAVMLAALFEAPSVGALARYLEEHHAVAVQRRYAGTAAHPHHGAAAGTQRQRGEL